jgi:chromosome segregation ATPase
MEKGNRISDLRNKTQELEKFKFVLDYKIKEMKQDIMPRETDAQKLHEQNTKMGQEVKHFDQCSGNLKLVKIDLRMRLEGLQREAKSVRQTLGGQ